MKYTNSGYVNPDDYVPQYKQQELIDLAESGAPATAVRLAIREGVFAALKEKDNA